MDVTDALGQKGQIPVTQCNHSVNPTEGRVKKRSKEIHADISSLWFKHKLTSSMVKVPTVPESQVHKMGSGFYWNVL